MTGSTATPERVPQPPLDEPPELPGISPTQRRDWRDLARNIDDLGREITALPGVQRQQIAETLEIARRALDPRRPYNISFVGVTGSGKSTLINALLGRTVLTSKSGRSTTGTIVTVRQKQLPPGGTPHEQALINFHSHESLAETVRAQCVTLGLGWVEDAAQPGRIDLEQTLQALGESTGGAQIVCATCGTRNRPGARRCAGCGRALAVTTQEAFEALRDVLEVARRKQQLIGQPPEVVPLSDAPAGDAARRVAGRDLALSGVELVQQLMDEQSDLNKDPGTRVIALIRTIEIESYQPPEAARQPLLHVDLTDIPGSGARTVRHDYLLQEYLNPRKTDAIVMVLDVNRPALMTNELVPLVERIMHDLAGKEREIDAERIFLVANKGDTPEAGDQEAQRNARDAVEEVARAIIPSFSQRYPKNIVMGLMAQPALITSLIRSDPEAGQRWLSGEDVPSFPQSMENGINRARDHYKSVMGWAAQAHPELDSAAAVGALSKLPEFLQTLGTFLGRSRWERDLRKARALYRSAHTAALGAIAAEWQQKFHQPLNAEVVAEREQHAATRVTRFGRALNQQAQEVLARFVGAREALKQAGRVGEVRAALEQVVQDVLGQIHTYTEQRRSEVIAIFVDAIQGDDYYHPAVDFLIKLNGQVFAWFDSRVGAVAHAMSAAFVEQIEQQGLRDQLAQLCRELPDGDRRLAAILGEIERIGQQYAGACRGALLSEVMRYRNVVDVVRHGMFEAIAIEEARQRAMGQANGYPTSPRGATERQIVQGIREAYQQAYAELGETLPDRLTQLFFYHVVIAEEKLTPMIADLGIALSQEVARLESELFTRMRAEEEQWDGEASRLIGIWKRIQRFSLDL
ncbi:MAG: hypothetical protein OHK0022_56070 [Roseiflexaceae bacterium]